MPFTFRRDNTIEDLIVIQPSVFTDERGFFMESYKSSDFRNNGIEENFVQDNLSLSALNTLRGLHFQTLPLAQGKLVSVLKGRAFDVAVDLRPESRTFMKWVSFVLDDSSRTMVYIPPGFGHGFLALENNVIFSYKCTNEYSPEHDSGIIWNDPDIGIKWPVEQPLVSHKDAGLKSTRALFG